MSDTITDREAIDAELEKLSAPPPPPHEPPATEPGWRRHKTSGREFTTRPGRSGLIYRHGSETVAEAIERDQQQPKDEKPRRKSKTAKAPPPTKKPDLKEIQAVLAEAFAAPAMICGAFGDEWAADHFTNQGPALAANLIRASEHNPWLRRKLEDVSAGGDAAMKLISLVGVAGALFAYAVPPLIYWFNIPVPDNARAMFGIPQARQDAPAPPAPPAPGV